MSVRSATAVKILSVVAAVAGLIVLQSRYDIFSWFDREHVTRLLQEAGSLAPVFYMLMMAAAVVISPIPSLPLDIAAGAFFGPVLGTIYSVLGALAGAVASFGLARLLGRRVVEKLARGHISFCESCSDYLLVRVVLLSRLIPIVSFDVVSYGAGLTKMRVRSFALATAVGMLPLTALYNTVGSVIVVSGWISLTVSGILVAAFLLLPGLIERRNLFGLRRFFHHLR